LLETNAKSIASDLIGHISKEQERKWQSGSPADWAVETFQVAKADAYGLLPEPSGRNTYRLPDEYVTTATIPRKAAPPVGGRRFCHGPQAVVHATEI
jgi:hypothetical protein